ncbi:MAG: restriction endonuclease subunit S [Nostoc sp. DedQUE08]|uniref:restriction endonuclease subunit S n=1 Tax=Nostoc sp. DedQUE08 TaxID=3075393 RepID=UPI002AD508B6|nr:restriction endonuclease subunit S [Nostoc sp. DedQUE08]MDZ8069389.1 restriction endonuclease subunit S [Nostoc sp. DedQUE08]
MMSSSEENELPASWAIARIADVTIPVEKINPESEPDKPFIYIDISGIDNQTNRIDQVKTYQGSDAPSRARQLVKYGDTLFSTVRTYLKNIALVPKKFDNQVASTGFSVLRASRFINNVYLFFYTLSSTFLQGLEAFQRGVSYPAVRDSDIRNQSIPIAPLDEQNRIVAKIEELFSELDKGVEYLKTAQEQLKVYRQSVLKYAFEGKLTKQWRETYSDQLETANQLLERIQQERESLYQQQLNEWEESTKIWEENGKEGKKPGKPQTPLNISSLTEEELVNLPDLPETWCWIKFSVLSERIQIGPFGSLLHRSDYVSNQVPIVNPVHIRNQKIEPDWSLTVTEKKVNELSNYIMYPGDIVMGRRGEMGRCAVITDEERGFLCGSGSLFIRLLPGINPIFYCYLLGSQRLKNYLSDQSVGTTMQNLNQEIIHNLPVPLCSPIEIQKIIEEVDRRTALITEVENLIEKNLLSSEILKQSILKKAFSGQLVPQGSGDENAAVLLERIREARRHQQEHQVPVPKPRKQVAMKKNLSIIEVLQELNGLATAQDVWRRSKHQEDIEGFYAELKKQINNGVIEEVEELREEKKSYLRLRNAN